ncbi:alpha/beta hydrolase [Cyclobacteriaceae bacterium]|nr:alpha/beta hydrolase [Cyclobacteriaceae bacterium]
MSSKLIYTSIIHLLIILCSHTVVGQQEKKEEATEVDKNSSRVYVISNRQTESKDSINFTSNNVKTSASLDFIIADFTSTDSLQIKKTDSTAFTSQITSIKGDWLIFVHGDSKTLEQSIYRGREIKELYNINVIVFSWPSKSSNLHGLRNLKNSQTNVAKSINHFHTLLQFAAAFRQKNSSFKDESKLSILFHSLGNLYMQRLIENHLQEGLPNDLFDNLILNAAAVNQKNHHEWVEKINIQNRIYINSNKHDFNLKGLRIFTSSGKQLGEKITPELAENVTYTHFDKSVGFKFKTGQTHTYFIGKIPDKSKNIKDFYSSLLHGEKPIFNNHEKFKLRKDSLGYEIMF